MLYARLYGKPFPLNQHRGRKANELLTYRPAHDVHSGCASGQPFVVHVSHHAGINLSLGYTCLAPDASRDHTHNRGPPI